MRGILTCLLPRMETWGVLTMPALILSPLPRIRALLETAAPAWVGPGATESSTRLSHSQISTRCICKLGVCCSFLTRNPSTYEMNTPACLEDFTWCSLPTTCWAPGTLFKILPRLGTSFSRPNCFFVPHTPLEMDNFGHKKNATARRPRLSGLRCKTERTLTFRIFSSPSNVLKTRCEGRNFRACGTKILTIGVRESDRCCKVEICSSSSTSFSMKDLLIGQKNGSRLRVWVSIQGRVPPNISVVAMLQVRNKRNQSKASTLSNITRFASRLF